MAAPAWYRSGTVATTNNLQTVTGTGTLWQLTGLGIKEGDLFTINGAQWYEIQSVNSHTSITLRTPYLGSTASGQSYAIVRAFTYSTSADLAIRLAAAMEKWHGYFDEFATWSAGSATGGPNGNGTYPLTGPTGTVVQAKSPARLTADVGENGDNIVINDHFNLWEEGNSFSLSSASRYTANLWRAVSGTGGVLNVTRQAHNNSIFNLVGNQRYYLRFELTTGPSSGTPQFCQRIPNVGLYAGNTITISTTLRGPVVQPISVYVVQNFGSGGSTEVTTLAGSITYTSNWTDYHLTLTVPSINGKSLGSAGDYLEIRYQGPLSAPYTVDFARCWVSPGTQPAVIRPRSPAQEWLLSRQFYRQSYPPGTIAGTATTLGAKITSVGATLVGSNRILVRDTVEWDTPMRATPTMAYYDLAGTLDRVTTDGASGRSVSSGSPVSFASPNGFQSSFNLSPVSPGEQVHFHWTADARL